MLIGMVGFAGSGKGTVGNIILDKYDFVADSFAAPLKDITASLFGWDRAMLEGDTDESRHAREQPDRFWSDEFEIDNFTPRMALQQLGTEGIRNNFHSDFWIISLKKRWIENGCKPTVVTDCRFPNEIDIIRALGGKIIHVQRGPNPSWYNDIMFANQGFADDYDLERIETLKATGTIPHESEIAWIGNNANHHIQNDGTLEDLETLTTDIMDVVMADVQQ